MPVISEPSAIASALRDAPPRPPCGAVLMADPAGFRVESVINPWMADATGMLNVIDSMRAREQWNALRQAYLSIDIDVQVIDSAPGMPDFCFCANQAVTFLDAGNRPAAILSRMRSPSRQPEVPLFERWYRHKGYQVHQLPHGVAPFEGTGDAIWHHGKRAIWGGAGPRTADTAWEHVAAITGAPVFPLRLVDPRYYHLDTCLCVLTQDTALCVPAAFDEASRQRLHKGFANLVAVDDEDAANFACNAHCPDDENVLIQKGSSDLVEALVRAGFGVIELDTSEFMKSGGSVFCLKQELV
ncbi:MAG: amidinotransferase [Planctomycetes bacterium]|nr:amidinotransferase [Planctomycetota bacterium]